MENSNFLIENFIPSGHANAISRSELCSLLGMNDRAVRRSIETAVTERRIPIVNIGHGYFKPDGSEIDRYALDAYYHIESAKAKSIFRRLHTIKNILAVDENQTTLEVSGD